MNVLLVDDHDLVRVGAAACLRALYPSVQVFEVDNCKGAISCAHRHPMDLVLLDLGFPGRPNDGIAALIRLKRELESICVVMHTGRPFDRDLVVDCLNKGAMGFIPKATKEEFVEGLRVVMSGRPYLPALMSMPDVRAFSPESLSANLENTNLTPSLRRLLPLLIQGKSYKQIAAQLDLSPQTIKNYMRPIFDEFGVANRTELIIYLVKRGWLSGD